MIYVKFLFKTHPKLGLGSIADLEFNEEATFGINNRGGYNLLYDNYTFLKHRILSGGSTYWRCVRQKSCKAKAHTKMVNNKHMVKVHGEHSH